MSKIIENIGMALRYNKIVILPLIGSEPNIENKKNFMFT